MYTYTFQIYLPSQVYLKGIRKTKYDFIIKNNKQQTNFVALVRKRTVPTDRLCGMMVRAPDYRSRGPGSIPGVTRFSEK
jgi:hypothetical protein